MVTSQQLRVFKRRMQRHPTVPERLFAERLTRLGVDFKAQVIIGFYCADFVVPSRLVVFELDGAGHDAAYDRRRDRFLNEAGFDVVRVENANWNTVDVLAILSRRAERPVAAFRSALARANASKGNRMNRL